MQGPDQIVGAEFQMPPNYWTSSLEGSSACAHLFGVEQFFFPRMFWVTWTGLCFRGHGGVCSQESVVQSMLSWAKSLASFRLSEGLFLPGRMRRGVVSRRFPYPNRRCGGTVSAKGPWDCADPRPLARSSDYTLVEMPLASPPNSETQQWYLEPYWGVQGQRVFHSLNIVVPFYLCCRF